MASLTENLIDAALTLLKANLPTKLTAAGETNQPTVDAKGYMYGEPELLPTSRCPFLSVDRMRWQQRSRVLGSQGPRNQGKQFDLEVTCFVTGATREELSIRLHRFSDAVVAVFEDSPDLSDNVMLAQVVRGDDSPTFKEPRTNRLFRGNRIEVQLNVAKQRGDTS